MDQHPLQVLGGGGGGGEYWYNNVPGNGGNGYDGQVRITYTLPPGEFTSSGTFTAPAGVRKVTVEAWGGGGKGKPVVLRTTAVAAAAAVVLIQKEISQLHLLIIIMSSLVVEQLLLIQVGIHISLQ